MAFRASVEQWRDLASQYADQVPADFQLDWIDKESGGNRCNLTTSAGFPEVGLFQLDPGNMALAGTDENTLRSGCNGQQDVGTPADQANAIATGVDYINALKAIVHAKLQSFGADWDESDPGFWSLVRLQHAAGTGASDEWLGIAANNLGRGPANWDEFISNGCCGSRGQHYFDHWTGVAAENGAYAAGFVGSISSKGWLLPVVGIVGLIAGAWLAHRITTRKFSLLPVR